MGSADLSHPPLAGMADRACGLLLDQRADDGRWLGELAGSALSTATAITALALADADGYAAQIRQGVDWLCADQQSDGGWGDTHLNRSNISTTVLGWSALGVVLRAGHGDDRASAAADRASRWIEKQVGSLEPEALAGAIVARYGSDRTFSVPILMHAAVAGRLGDGSEAWRWVPQLPFELASLPRHWFARLNLQVVSYALPALIAIGQVRHTHRRSWNGLLNFWRDRSIRSTGELLHAIQPASGGYLEATPLTAFVVMALIDAGRSDHPVVFDGLRFLVDQQRDSGSWPIDTCLTTWVSSLAIHGLDAGGRVGRWLSASERKQLVDWYLDQQFTEVHPFTQSPPGGWSWCDLSGGVPDADDTPGAMLALSILDRTDPRVPSACRQGVRWLGGLQNRNGGIPTFCHGWGRLPFDRSSVDLTAHTLRAWGCWGSPNPTAVGRAKAWIASQQRADGAWLPLWFGNQAVADETNPVYATSRVLPALAGDTGMADCCRRGVDWLLAVESPSGGWGGDRGVSPSIEETALVIEALSAVGIIEPSEVLQAAVRRGVSALWRLTDGLTDLTPSPIGFYFAKLWYYEKLYPLVWTVSGLERARVLLGDGA